ncbi:MAG: glutamine synthetase [Mycobacterium sp.]|jgi:hypothetical protein|nr:glutamine synthetase [Mycobacterium sp.]
MPPQIELAPLVAAGDVDTEIVAFCDMQGRLTGKRVSAQLKARAHDPHRVPPSLPDPASRRAT